MKKKLEKLDKLVLQMKNFEFIFFFFSIDMKSLLYEFELSDSKYYGPL